MKISRWTTPAAFAAALSLTGALAAATSAAPLEISQTSARQAAAQLSDKYGVNIVFKDGVNTSRVVSITLANADTAGSRLEAVSELANATRADFMKKFVVSKVAGDGAIPEPRIDSSAPVVFPRTTLPAKEAISLVAAVDNATVEMSGLLDETVTLPASTMSAAEAAQEIANQTHTRWKAFYALISRSSGRQMGGRVVGRTKEGLPIIELPSTSYLRTPSEADRRRQAADQANGNTQANGDQQVATGSPVDANGNPLSGYDPYSAYSFGTPYGYDPSQMGYGYPGDGSGPGGSYDTGSGLTIDNGYGYGDPIIFQQTYGWIDGTPYPQTYSNLPNF